jgi:hypothetical protein
MGKIHMDLLPWNNPDDGIATVHNDAGFGYILAGELDID